LLATGGSAFVPPIEGKDVQGVFTYRGFSDTVAIKKAAANANNIVIGLEMASNLKKLNPKANITVIEKNETPFERVLGKAIGKALQQ
jgi:NAD(P)H-nitrite reductase large subunit